MEQKKPSKNGRTGKSSKTAHVLNLLSGSQTPVETSDTSDRLPPSAPAGGPSLPVLEIAKNNNQQLSESIHAALETALEQELQAETEKEHSDVDLPRDMEPPVVPESPKLQTLPLETLSGEAPEKAPQPVKDDEPSAYGPVPSSDKQETEAVSSQVPDSSSHAKAFDKMAADWDSGSTSFGGAIEQELPDGSVFLNVTAILTEEFFQRYSGPAGLCPCPRCQADARAMALSRLAPKYVVLPAPAKSPMLALYRNELRTDLLTQVLMSCHAVQEHPRHMLKQQESAGS